MTTAPVSGEWLRVRRLASGHAGSFLRPTECFWHGRDSDRRARRHDKPAVDGHGIGCGTHGCVSCAGSMPTAAPENGGKDAPTMTLVSDGDALVTCGTRLHGRSGRSAHAVHPVVELPAARHAGGRNSAAAASGCHCRGEAKGGVLPGRAGPGRRVGQAEASRA